MSLNVRYFSHYIPLYWGNDYSGWYNGLFSLRLLWEFILVGQSIGHAGFLPRAVGDLKRPSSLSGVESLGGAQILQVSVNC